MTILPRPLPKVLGLAVAVTSLMATRLPLPSGESDAALPEDAERRSPTPVMHARGRLRRPNTRRPEGSDERDMHAAVIKRTRKALKRIRDEARSTGGRIEPLEVLYTEFVNGELQVESIVSALRRAYLSDT